MAGVADDDGGGGGGDDDGDFGRSSLYMHNMQCQVNI